MTRYLDSIARWILTNCDYHVLGIVIIFALLGFGLWRKTRYRLWPTQKDYFLVGMSLIGMIGGLTATLIFLFTQPPAVNLLSGPTLLFLGLAVPIVVIGNAYSQLSVLFFPPEAPKPVDNLSDKEREQELLWDFILDAIGLEECLTPDDHEPGTISFITIELRIQLLQQSEPERAIKCGVPAIGDTLRESRIKSTLRGMVKAGKLQRCRQEDRWVVLDKRQPRS